MVSRLKDFTLNGKIFDGAYIATNQVKMGVECDVYVFVGDKTKDLAIIRVQSGFTTPLQKVVSGNSTIEGHLEGDGRLVITSKSGQTIIYEFGENLTDTSVEVHVGESMQWQATGETELTFFEVCTPPYEEGRFENQ